MNDEERRRFRQVATECAPTMIGLAYVITGSQRGAEQALRRALARTARRWRVARDEPERHVLSALCRYETSWRRRLRAGTQPPEAADGAPGPVPGWDLRGAMRRAVLSLPRAERVVVALRHYEGLTDAEIAEVLGCSVNRVRRDEERARARLRELLADLSAPLDDPPAA